MLNQKGAHVMVTTRKSRRPGSVACYPDEIMRLLGSMEQETAVREACATGTYVDSKQLFQFFETPHDVATRMLAELPAGPGAYDVLEPNAGDGALVRAALSMRRRGLAAFDLGREVRVTAIELDPKRCVNLRKEFSAGSGVERVLERDFLTVTPEETSLFDWILMNPPFSRGQDMAHVRHAFEFLRAGGTLVAIMSPGFEYRSDAASALFRDWLSLRQSADMASWHPLPEGSFKTSGTNVRTVMLTIKRGK